MTVNSKTKSSVDLRDALLAEIQDCGLSQTELAKRAGINQAALSRFTTSAGGLTFASAAKVAAVLGLELRKA